VHTRLRALLPLAVGSALLIGLGIGTLVWLGRNPFADGTQNEYLHVGNAFDLWDALRARDLWHLRYYVAHAYWPPGFYAAPWPLLALLGRGRDPLVLTNLAWLALALAAVHGLAERRRAGIAAMLLLALSPGVFGPLVRFEPSVAQAACLGWALLALHRSRGLTRLGWSFAAGLALALGLITDRLGVAPFAALPGLLVLLPAPPPPAPTARVRIPPDAAASLPEALRWHLPWRGLLLYALPVLALAGPWYLQWFFSQAAEVGSQLAAGEIDSAGAHTEVATALGHRWAYYPLVLLDSQAGPVLGAWMLGSLAIAALRRLRALGSGRRPEAEGLALAAALSGLLLLSAVQKKQVFYTLPLLVPLAVLGGNLAARAGVLRAPLVFGLALAGLAQYGGRLWGYLPPHAQAWAGADPLPAAWVEPRHTLARPPSDDPFPLEPLKAALGVPGGRLILFSDFPVYYEGFLSLTLREMYPGVPVHGLRGDPAGTYEWFRTADAFLCVSESSAWPDQARLDQALKDDHYDLAAIPPVTELVVRQEDRWEIAATWPLASATATVWKRK
jgi:hypothetical protein